MPDLDEAPFAVYRVSSNLPGVVNYVLDDGTTGSAVIGDALNNHYSRAGRPPDRLGGRRQ